MLYTKHVRAPDLSSWFTLEVGMKVNISFFIIRKFVFFVVVPVPNKFLMAIVSLDFIVELNLSNLSLPGSSLMFGDMSSLKNLVLSKTGLRHLHPSIGRLRSLESLSLSHNHLYDLPITIRLLNKLQHLDISRNLFRSLPGGLYHMHNLKKLEGLQENLLEQNPEWKDENHFITYTSPLKKQLVTLDIVQKLSDISIQSAVGLNVWRIPLPEQHRSDIIEKSITLDLCEHCLTPVKRIMEDQETNGFQLKVCLIEFCEMRNVPFKFLTCSATCRDMVIERFSRLQSELKIKGSNQKLPEILLKDQHYRAQPFKLDNSSC
uniref:Uncharacterized protein n=1 Tax=Amphimedon queenslandica TaxID=400682 RepID=A0A1X7UYA8_AMPQE